MKRLTYLVLIALLAIPAIAQTKTKNHKLGGGSTVRVTSTLSSITVGEKSVTIALASGETLVVPKEKVKVIDHRGGKRKQSLTSNLAAGQKVIVKTHRNAKGEIRSVRVKITG